MDGQATIVLSSDFLWVLFSIGLLVLLMGDREVVRVFVQNLYVEYTTISTYYVLQYQFYLPIFQLPQPIKSTKKKF